MKLSVDLSEVYLFSEEIPAEGGRLATERSLSSPAHRFCNIGPFPFLVGVT